jgi:DNA-binding beta-propeller fold protein YncE
LVVPLPAENAVQVYAINPANGTLTADSLVPAGSSPNAVGFDSTGQFAYVTDGGCWGYGVSTCGAGPGTNTINAFTFNSANGELQLLGSYPTGEDPLSIAVVKF